MLSATRMFAGCLSGIVLLVSTTGKQCIKYFEASSKLIQVFIFTKNLHCPRNWIHVNLYIACFLRVIADWANEKSFQSIKGYGSPYYQFLYPLSPGSPGELK